MTKCFCKPNNIYFGDLSHLITNILLLCAKQQQHNIVCSPPPWVNKRGQICVNKTKQNKTFTHFRLLFKTR